MNPPAVSLRPTSVTLIASLNLALELVCGLVCNPAMLLVMTIPSALRTQIFDEGFHGNEVYYSLSLALLVISLMGTLVSIVGNIAMLNMRAWGRRIVVGYAVFSIASCLAVLGTSAWFDGSALVSGGLGAQRRSELILGLVLEGGCLFIIGLLYPVLQIYVLTRREVVDAFLRPAFDPGMSQPWSPQWNPTPPNPWEHFPPSAHPPQVPPPPPYPPPAEPRDR